MFLVEVSICHKKQVGKKVYISAHFLLGNVWKVEIDEKLEICRGVLPFSLAQLSDKKQQKWI